MVSRAAILCLNLLSLSAMTVMEIIRPGFVSGAVNLGWVWLGAVGLTIIALAKTKHQN